MILKGFKCGTGGEDGYVNPDAVTTVRGSMNGPNFTDICTSDGKVITAQGSMQETIATLGAARAAQSVEMIPVRRHVLSDQEIVEAQREKLAAENKLDGDGNSRIQIVGFLAVGAIIGVLLTLVGLVFTHAFGR